MSDKAHADLLQTIRRSHCSHERADDPGHGCAGCIRVTPSGYELDCPTCGPDEQPLALAQGRGLDLAAECARAIGMEWGSLSADAQRRLAATLAREHCPSCGQRKPAKAADYHACGCGWAWYGRGGWLSAEAREAQRRDALRREGQCYACKRPISDTEEETG